MSIDPDVLALASRITQLEARLEDVAALATIPLAYAIDNGISVLRHRRRTRRTP